VKLDHILLATIQSLIPKSSGRLLATFTALAFWQRVRRIGQFSQGSGVKILSYRGDAIVGNIGFQF
jgi:hypothetical protein